VTYERLVAAGCTRDVIRGLRTRGALIPIHHHVFAVAGAPSSYEQTVLAAVLAVGKQAFASHETGARLMGLPLPGPAALEVTTMYERCPSVPGVRLHRWGLLEDGYVCTLGAIPTVCSELVIIGLSSRHTLPVLGSMTDEALRRRLTTASRIAYVAERLGRAPGRSPKRIAEMLDRRVPGVDTNESVLEDFISYALHRFKLPRPVSQYRQVVGGRARRIDHCYPDRCLALEAKGFEYHGGRERFDDDALRGNELLLAGYRVLTFTSAFTDVQIARQVAAALGRPPPRPARAVSFEEWKRLR
jgi:hypothetical protein